MEHVTGGTSSPGLKSWDSVPQVVDDGLGTIKANASIVIQIRRPVA
jgi:hypothetical protein